MNKHWETIRLAAMAAGFKPVTIRKWKSRRRVAYAARHRIEQQARKMRRKLPYEAFDA